MPNQLVQQASGTPSPATITPELLKQHSITPDEYTRIEAALGRTPSPYRAGHFFCDVVGALLLQVVAGAFEAVADEGYPKLWTGQRGAGAG